jgi:hypothetical protein
LANKDTTWPLIGADARLAGEPSAIVWANRAAYHQPHRRIGGGMGLNLHPMAAAGEP